MDAGLISIDKSGTVKLSLENISRIVSGPEEAVQYAAWALFTTPGTFLYSKPDGGGILTLIDGSIGSVGAAKLEAAICVKSALKTIQRNQSPSKEQNAQIKDMKLSSVDVVGRKIKLVIFITLASGNGFSVTYQLGLNNAS